MSMLRQVLVLNSTYEPVNVCSTRRALVLLLKDKAESRRDRGRRLSIRRDRRSPYPMVIRFTTYVRVPRPDGRRLSRRAILARDGFRCQYCGSTRHLTIDHIVPRSRGGLTSWDNVVTSCAPATCAKERACRSEVGMAPSRRPRPPAAGRLRARLAASGARGLAALPRAGRSVAPHLQVLLVPQPQSLGRRRAARARREPALSRCITPRRGQLR